MAVTGIDALRESLGAPAVDPVYAAKMLHVIPPATVVDRSAFVLERVAGRVVLEFGATGPLHDAVVKAARKVYGFDRPQHERPDPFAVRDDVAAFDLDDVSQDELPQVPWAQPSSEPKPELVLCGEVLEHLSNPGWFLTRLRGQYPGLPVIITVPNAFSAIASSHAKRGIDNVNRDHVAWYSYRTLRTLLERAGYGIAEFHWYNGAPYTAEGLIVVTE